MWQRWNTDGAQGHMGVAVAGMPNTFFLMGPNTGVAHTSIVFMIEQQIKFVLRAMDGMQQRGADSIQVRQDAQDRFNEDIQRRSRQTGVDKRELHELVCGRQRCQSGPLAGIHLAVLACGA